MGTVTAFLASKLMHVVIHRGRFCAMMAIERWPTKKGFDLAMTALQYSSGDLTRVQVTLNGDIALNSYSMEFAKFSEDISYSGSAQTISVSGSLTGGCLDGWVTFTTLSPVQTNGYSECPVGGGMQISGDSDMMVTFNSDGSVNIGDQTYTSCNDLPDTCQ